MKIVKALKVLFVVFTVLFAVTFAIYYFNGDMKLVRKIYDKLQGHYDNLQKDRKL